MGQFFSSDNDYASMIFYSYDDVLKDQQNEFFVNNKFIIMLNPLIKNCRTGFHDDLLNRTAHYLKLTQIRTNIRNQPQSRYQSHSQKKVQIAEQQDREHQNQKMLNKLISISRSTKRHIITQPIQQDSLKKSMKSQFKERQKQLSISEDNVRFMKKLESIESHMKQFKAQRPKNRYSQDPQKKSRFAYSIKKINQIDSLYYNAFKLQMIKDMAAKSKIKSIGGQRAKKKNRKQRQKAKINLSLSKMSYIQMPSIDKAQQPAYTSLHQ